MRESFLFLFVLLCQLSTLAGNEYSPLDAGDEWTLEVLRIPPTGDVSTGVFHRKIGGSVEKGGKTYFQSRTWTEGMSKNYDDTTLMRKDNKAIYSIASDGSLEHLEGVLPLKTGLTWQVIEGSNTINHTVTGLEDIEISGKIYENCFHIRITRTDGKLVVDEWEAPNVGAVKMEVLSDEGVKMVFTLKEFKTERLTDSDYFPLAVGQETISALVMKRDDGKVIFEGVMHNKIEGPIKMNGKTYVRIRAWWERMPNNPDSIKLVRKDEKGFYCLKGPVEMIETVFPLKVGEKWNKPMPTGTVTVSVIGVETVEVSDQSYKNCYHLRGTNSDNSYTDDSWEAPNIGVHTTIMLKKFIPGR